MELRYGLSMRIVLSFLYFIFVPCILLNVQYYSLKAITTAIYNRHQFLQTEQIRRINRLWASDSLFLREHLLIPINTDINSASICNNELVAPEEHDIPPNVSKI